MPLENKLGITDSATLAKEEERISKTRAVELFESGLLSSLPAGTFGTLCRIHAHLFSDIYDFAVCNLINSVIGINRCDFSVIFITRKFRRKQGFFVYS